MWDSAFCGAGINIPPVIVEMKNLMKDLKGLLGEFRGWPTVELFSVRLAGLPAEDRERHLLGFCKLAFGHYEELPMGYRRLVDGYLDGERGENLMVWYLTRHTPWKNARYELHRPDLFCGWRSWWSLRIGMGVCLILIWRLVYVWRFPSGVYRILIRRSCRNPWLVV